MSFIKKTWQLKIKIYNSQTTKYGNLKSLRFLSKLIEKWLSELNISKIYETLRKDFVCKEY